MKLNEKSLGFQDYRLKNIHLLGAKSSTLNVGDIVADGKGIIGIVRFSTEKEGSFIEFIDGYTAYDKEIKVKKLSVSNEQLFLHNQKYYGFITRVARTIEESIKGSFPYTNMFNNGKEVFVRASTLMGVVKKNVSANITRQHSFFSIKLTPFYNCEIEEFDVELSKRRSRFAFNMLKNMFIDIDLNVKQSNRIRFTVTDSNEYNIPHWEKIDKMFKKFGIRYVKF